MAIMIDVELPRNEGVPVDVWWAKLIERYPNLSKVALAMLSIFHGPHVESSFSMMGNVLDKKSKRMNLATYLAIQTVKYSIADNKASSNGCKSIASFKRDDIHTSPVMPLLSNNMQSA